MVLNPDCIRDVLIAIESLDFGEYLTLDALCARLPTYTKEEIHYTCLKLDEGGFLDVMTVTMTQRTMPGIKQINGLTFGGHEFLDSVRETSNWAKVKDVAKKAGTFSLQSLAAIAQEVAKAAIQSALKLKL